MIRFKVLILIRLTQNRYRIGSICIVYGFFICIRSIVSVIGISIIIIAIVSAITCISMIRGHRLGWICS